MKEKAKAQGMTTAKFLLLFGGVGLFGMLFSAVSKGGTPCVIYGIFGIPCPSCGMSRAYAALLGGQISDAFFYHPLFWLVPVVSLIPQLRKRWSPLVEKRAYFLVLALLLLVWIVRLILYFPQSEPMLWNKNALLPTLFHQLK